MLVHLCFSVRLTLGQPDDASEQRQRGDNDAEDEQQAEGHLAATFLAA